MLQISSQDVAEHNINSFLSELLLQPYNKGFIAALTNTKYLLIYHNGYIASACPVLGVSFNNCALRIINAVNGTRHIMNAKTIRANICVTFPLYFTTIEYLFFRACDL